MFEADPGGVFQKQYTSRFFLVQAFFHRNLLRSILSSPRGGNTVTGTKNASVESVVGRCLVALRPFQEGININTVP